MNRTQLLSTAAALLLLGAGAASAQAPAKDQAPAQPAPAAQQKAPAEKTAPAMKPGEHKATDTTGQAAKPEMKGAADTKMNPAPDSKSAADSKMNAAPDSKAKATADTKMNAAPDSNKAADSNKTPDAKASDANKSAPAASTTGQGAAGAAKLSTEQRSKITTVIRQQKVERIEPSKLNISISVGTRVPSTVRYYPLPREVIVIYPEWRGYDYILVGDQIVILDPRSHEIVAILDA